MDPTDKEFETLEAEIAYWKELSDYLPGWSLMGWTYRQGATYRTPNHWGGHLQEEVVNLTGRQRDDLVAALKAQFQSGIEYATKQATDNLDVEHL